MQRKYVTFLVITLAIIALDQWTKYLVVRDLTHRFDGLESVGARLGAFYTTAPTGPWGLHFPPGRPTVLSEDFLMLRYAENPGAAWGLFRTLPENVRGPLFHVVSIGAVILITFYFSKLSGKDKAERWAYFGLPLVLGGAIGNYLDRLARGFVVDFIEAHWKHQGTFPSFNVADSAICVGVGMLIIDAFVRRERPNRL